MNIKVEASPSLWAILLNGSEQDSDQARKALIMHYQFLVEGMARKLKSRLPTWVRDDDLISYGQIGLIKAVDRYDPEAGPFRSFASAYVHGAILDELRAQDWAPRGLRRDQKLIASVVSSLENVEDEEAKPTKLEVAEELGWTEERLTKTLKKIENSQHVQLDQSTTYQESATIDSDFSATYLCKVFGQVFDRLSPVSQIVLARKYFLNEKMTKIVADTKLPPTYIRQAHLDALDKVFTAAFDAVT